LDMPEDLLGEDQSKQRSRSQAPQSRHVMSKRSQLTSESTLDELVTKVANVLEIAKQELRQWIQYAALPEAVLKTILVTAKRYQLNLILSQIDWEINEENHWQIYIPIDGWISLIHRQSTFQGIAFDQPSETEDGVPIWMECTIFRAELAHPMTVREYYAELKTKHPMWSQMPRRMLRHKTLKECARLAFGINAPELKIPIVPCIKKDLVFSNQEETQCNHKELLKRKLRIK